MAERSPSWFSDPDDPSLARWHDGTGWTQFTMVVAEWTSPEAPPPPAGWSPAPSPTEKLVPAFRTQPAPPAPEAPSPATPPAAPPAPAPTPPAVARPAARPPIDPRPTQPVPTISAEPAAPRRVEPAPPTPAGSDTSFVPEDHSAPLPPTTRDPLLDASPAPPVERPPVRTDPEELPRPEPVVPADSGVRIDAPPAGDAPARPRPGPRERDDLLLGDPNAHGVEVPGEDWGAGPQLARPSRRPSGWNDDLDAYDQTVHPTGPPTLAQRYRWAPGWVRLGIPLLAIAVVAALSILIGGGGGDGEVRAEGDGTLEPDVADEPGMQAAIAKARDSGAPASISDRALAGLIDGVCGAARRSLVSLDLSEDLAATGVSSGDLLPAATAIGNGALELCPEQTQAIPQVVGVLVSRTERMLSTTTTS